MCKVCFTFYMDANTLIERLGGTVKVSELCEVSAQAVSQWRTEGIPKARLMFLKLARPDVFGIQKTKPKGRPLVDHSKAA